tara:strand:+ start:125 stop:298 length:174 start_codon:yes stop_codon:yes gene_type:complete
MRKKHLIKNISNWDVTRVSNMDYMFISAASFNQPIGNWDVSNVKTMKGMFQRAYLLS